MTKSIKGQQFRTYQKMPELPLDQWLKPEDVKPEAELVFIDKGVVGEFPAKDDEPAKPKFEVTVEFKNGQRRLWTMNKTSQRAVATAYGTNTDNWVGKQVTAFTTEQNVRGTMKDVIYARVPGQTTTPPAKLEPQVPT